MHSLQRACTQMCTLMSQHLFNVHTCTCILLRKQDRKPTIILSDSACFLSSSQKWIGEGKSPSMHGNPDADIMRDVLQLLRERIEQGLLTIFIMIKAHRRDPLNELADRWADEGRHSENIRWSLPTNRPTESSTRLTTARRTVALCTQRSEKELTSRYHGNNSRSTWDQQQIF